MNIETHQLRDVHAPGVFIDGVVSWRMAAGSDALDVGVTASALHLFSDRTPPNYLAIFEENRADLSRLAATKFAVLGRDRSKRIVLDGDDLSPAPKFQPSD